VGGEEALDASLSLLGLCAEGQLAVDDCASEAALGEAEERLYAAEINDEGLGGNGETCSETRFGVGWAV
jgi:hypothetical protein